MGKGFIDTYWYSTTKMTIMVEEEDGVIIKAPPIVYKFLGQPLVRLEKWLQKQEGYRKESL